MSKGKIFNAQEVQNILSGNKTMFREVIKVPPTDSSQYCAKITYSKDKKNVGNYRYINISKNFDCPYQVGQKIFMKEVFSHSNQRWCDKTMFYKASHGNRIQNTFSVANREDKWRSPAIMHEEYSRLTLQIKEIRVEKLSEISEEDAIAEGIPLSDEFKDRYYTPENNYAVPKIAFMRWWNATHKKPEEKFDANPFVWSIQFEVVK
jgi:hypothetical protein